MLQLWYSGLFVSDIRIVCLGTRDCVYHCCRAVTGIWIASADSNSPLSCLPRWGNQSSPSSFFPTEWLPQISVSLKRAVPQPPSLVLLTISEFPLLRAGLSRSPPKSLMNRQTFYSLVNRIHCASEALVPELALALRGDKGRWPWPSGSETWEPHAASGSSRCSWFSNWASLGTSEL